MKKKILASLCAIFAVCFGLISQQNVFANTTTLNVSPMTQRISLTPGETYTGSVKVSNPAAAEHNLDYSVSVGSFNVFDSNFDNVSTTTITDYNQIMDWISLSQESGSVAPNETQIINFYINVPLDAPAGGQYATIIISDDTDIAKENSGNVVISEGTSIASIIYADVAGETIRTGAILENNIPSFVTSGSITANSTVENTGNVHADAEYILQVFPLFSDEEVYTNEENPQKFIVLPDTTRYAEQNWEGTPAVGIFKVRQTVKIVDETTTVEKIVVKCPLWLLFVIILAVIALVVWLVLKSKNRKKSNR